MRFKGLLLFGLVAGIVIFNGCGQSHIFHHRGSVGSSHLRIDVDLVEGDREAVSAGSYVIERQWTSPSAWYPKPDSKWLNLQVQYVYQDGNSTYITGIHVVDHDANISWPGTDQAGEQVGLFFESGLGELTFSGQIGDEVKRWGQRVKSSGTVRIEINEDQAKKIGEVFGQAPSLEVALSLILKNVDAEKINAYANCGVKFTIVQAGELVRTGYSIENIKKLVDDGYTFSADEIIKLARYNVSYSYINEWKEHQYDLSADELVYAKQRNLSAKHARQWKDAGFDVDLKKVYWIKQRNLNPKTAIEWEIAGYKLDLEQLYWIKQRNLNPKTAIEWETAGYKLDLEQQYWIKQRNLNPETATEWKAAGYDLDIEQLYWIRQRNLRANEAGMWKKAGYDFSLEQLYKLKQYNIDVDYGKAFADPGYELLTIDELIKFKQSRISKETINKLRKQKVQ